MSRPAGLCQRDQIEEPLSVLGTQHSKNTSPDRFTPHNIHTAVSQRRSSTFAAGLRSRTGQTTERRGSQTSSGATRQAGKRTSEQVRLVGERQTDWPTSLHSPQPEASRLAREGDSVGVPCLCVILPAAGTPTTNQLTRERRLAPATESTSSAEPRFPRPVRFRPGRPVAFSGRIS